MIKSIKEEHPKKRRKFDDTFKREAVESWLSSGRSATQVAEEFGITADRLYSWKKRFGIEASASDRSLGPLGAPQDDLRAELEEARRELRRVREQRDILKKTLGILSEPSDRDSKGSKR